MWKITDLGRGWSSPVIVRDRLYITGDVGDKLVIYAYDLDGKQKWKAANGRSWTGPYPGARACCAYSEGKLYHLNAHGRVACLDAATGNEIWACRPAGAVPGPEVTWGLSECLLVDGPRLIVTPGGGKALMAALDKQTGRTVWTTAPLSRRQGLAFAADHLPPCRQADHGQLLFGPRLRRRCRHGQAAVDGAAAEPIRDQRTTPVYHAGKHLLRHRLRLRDLLSLATRSSRAAAREGLDHHPGYLHRRRAAGRRPALRQRLPEAQVVALPGLGVGQVRYEFKGLPTTSAVYADGRLYCLADDGRAALAEARRPSNSSSTGQFRLVPDKVHDAWAYPVLLHGRLYLRYHDTLWCYDVRSK